MLVTGTDGADIIFADGLFQPDELFAGRNPIGQATDGDDTITGGAGNDVILSGAGQDIVDGGAGDDIIGSSTNVFAAINVSAGYVDTTAPANGDYAVYGVDVLRGGADNDMIYAGEGDTIDGGTGVDTLYLDLTLDYEPWVAGTVLDWFNNLGVNVHLADAVDGTVILPISSLFGDTLMATTVSHVEAYHIIFGGGNDVAYGGDYNDILTGDQYNFLYGDDELHGGGGNDILDGSGGGDVLYGDDGNDHIDGGVTSPGYDDYAADQLSGGDGNDFLIYHPLDTLDGGDGIDTVVVSEFITAVIDLAVTDVQDTGGGNTGRFLNVENINGAYGNDIFYGNDGANVLSGEYGDDQLFGRGGNDKLVGASGNDWLDGGGGTNTLYGGSGDDTYVVRGASDKVSETYSSGEYDNGGIDTVRSAITYTLGAYIDNLILTGTNALNGTGNSLDNNLTGNDANNTLKGLDGNDFIDGAGGADTMTGGAGDDTYVVGNKFDKVTESANQGADTVLSSITYALGDNVENLTLTGTANIDATGNGLNNTLYGNAGDNRIDGGVGADKMYGGAGNDTYIVNNGFDQVNEHANEGAADIVLSSVTFSLGNYVENLTLTGTAGINATGNGLGNVITGNGAANILDGHAGNDTLTGGGGADIFLFKSGSGADVITDFSVADGDTIDASAYHGVAHTITQAAGDAVIDFGGGNTITVRNMIASDAGFLSHIVF